MCTIKALSTVADCGDLKGGVSRVFIFPRSELTAVTTTVGSDTVVRISGLTMATPGKIVQWTPARDNAVQFVQTGNRSEQERLTYAREGTLIFRGFSAVQAQVADLAAKCCEVVVIYVMKSGERIVQGIELDAGATGGFVVDGNQVARVIPTATTGTNDAAPQLTFTIASNGDSLSPFTTLTDSALLAL
jgi:hypothetical protein